MKKKKRPFLDCNLRMAASLEAAGRLSDAWTHLAEFAQSAPPQHSVHAELIRLERSMQDALAAPSPKPPRLP